MSKNMEKKNWLITYVDMYDDIIKQKEVSDMTADEAVMYAETNIPHDRAIEDYHIEPLKTE